MGITEIISHSKGGSVGSIAEKKELTGTFINLLINLDTCLCEIDKQVNTESLVLLYDDKFGRF